MEDSAASGKSELLCKVCGDKASGKHYGVSSCDGCRGFFKRSIRRNLEYVCKENGRCIVDVTRRNQCQACRFRKCLHVNMKRDAVQNERAPRAPAQSSMHHYPLSFAPRLRQLQQAPFYSGLQMLHAPSILDASVHTGYAPQASLVYPHLLQNSALFSSTSAYSKPLFSLAPHHLVRAAGQQMALKEDEVTSSEEAGATKENALGKRKEEGNEGLLPPVMLFASENIYESAAKLLFLSIKWARSIPSFLQLSFRDQSVLLEESWSELFILTAAQWSLPIEESVLLNNTVAPSTRQHSLEADAKRLRDVISRLTLLRVDHTEHACLKALVLFKGECLGLCETRHVEVLQDQTHIMLSDYCTQRQGNHKGRFGKLLLALPAVQSVTKRGLEELLFKQTVGDVSIDRLLADLAKATQNN